MNESRTTLRIPVKLAALAVAAALGTSAAVAQQSDDPSQIERDRAGISQSPSESAGQSQAQNQPGAGQQSQSQAGQQPQPGQASQQASQQSQSSQQGQGQSQQGGGSAELQSLTQEHDNLGTFVEAVQAAGLADSLTDGTQYTLFAPTDEAFEELGQEAEELMKPENREQLVALLRAHIVADDVDPQMARSIGQALTIDGGTLELSAEGEQLMVGDASVVESDVQQGNLRIYPIDQVLDASPGAGSAQASAGSQSGQQSAASQSQSQQSSGQQSAASQSQQSSGQESAASQAQREAGEAIDEAGDEAETAAERLEREAREETAAVRDSLEDDDI